MTKKKKQTEEPKIEELSNEELEQAQGGGIGFIKFQDIEGESKLATGVKFSNVTLKRG